MERARINKFLSKKICKNIGSKPKACYINTYRTLITNEIIAPLYGFRTLHYEEGYVQLEYNKRGKKTQELDNQVQIVIGYVGLGDTMARHMWMERAGQIIDPTIALHPSIFEVAKYVDLVSMDRKDYRKCVVASKTMSIRGLFDEEEDKLVKQLQELGYRVIDK